MSFLDENHINLNLDPGFQVPKEYRSYYLTIISFLKFVDKGSGFTEKYLKDRFSHRHHFRIMLEKLISHSILKKSHNDNYFLNIQPNNLESPVFENHILLVNKNKYNKATNLYSKFIYS